MIRSLWALSTHIRAFLRRYMPTNIALDAIRTRRGLKWGVPAMLLAVPYLLIASTCTNLIHNGAHEWMNLILLLCIWNALKFLWIGPVSLVHLVRANARKHRAHQAVQRS
ncbi:sulfate permease [Microbacterium sp. AGC85]